MAIKVNAKYLENFIGSHEYQAIEPAVQAAHKTLNEKSGLGNDFLGWVDLPVNYDKEEFSRIVAAAKKIRKSCQVLVVIGIGGSYLGARAAIEFMKSPFYNALATDTPQILFAGNNISGSYLNDILAQCEGKDICVNVISKSGTTTEPALAFRVFRQLLEDKYGQAGAKERIFCTTDKAKGTLKELCDKQGYESFVIADDIGGRYSVLTAVGLLPMAVAGIDIQKVMEGAAKAREAFCEPNLAKNDCYLYAAIRNILYSKGKKVEVVVSYEPCFVMMTEWIKQLFGESEGKDGKGIFPYAATFSTDLHSIGQFIQEGSRIMFESVVHIKEPASDAEVQNLEGNFDGLNFVAGKQMSYINDCAFKGTVLAHTQGGVPNIVLELDDTSEESFGYMVYFFEKACAISGYLLGVNPFNQPGVEGYKKNMFALLGKPGYQQMQEQLLAQLGE